MWSDRKSMLLSKGCVVLFMALLVFGIFLLTKYLHVTTRVYLQSLYGWEIHFMLTVYTGGVTAAALLVYLYALLHRIGAGEVFVRKNTQCLRHISWCCIIGAVIAAVSAGYWIPWLAVAVAAGFMGLIVRVVKNVFAEAVTLQDDAEFTI